MLILLLDCFLPFVEIQRSSRWRCSVKKGALKNFAIFTEKHLCGSLFLIKFQAWRHTSDHNCISHWKNFRVATLTVISYCEGFFSSSMWSTQGSPSSIHISMTHTFNIRKAFGKLVFVEHRKITDTLKPVSIHIFFFLQFQPTIKPDLLC